LWLIALLGGAAILVWRMAVSLQELEKTEEWKKLPWHRRIWRLVTKAIGVGAAENVIVDAWWYSDIPESVVYEGALSAAELEEGQHEIIIAGKPFKVSVVSTPMAKVITLVEK